MDINNLFGLPAHPLLMHVPVLGIPVCALLALAYLLRPAWRAGLALPFGVFTAVIVVFTIVVAGSGEQLEKRVEPSALLHKHTELGDQTKLIVIAFGAATLLGLILDWYGRRAAAGAPATGRDSAAVSTERNAMLQRAALVVCLVSVVLGGVATVWDVRTGHSGARSVWGDLPAAAATPSAASSMREQR